MNFSIRHIEIFYYTVKFNSLSIAADKLCISQAAASMALKGFEEQIGEKLFDRVGKKLILNDNGRAILPLCTDIINKSLDLSTCFADSSGLSGRLTIGASSTIGNYVLPFYISKFINEYDMKNICMCVGNTDEVTNKVLKFEVDFGIVEGACYNHSVDVIHWMEDELVIFASTDHYLASKDYVSIKDLMKADWILREKGSGARRRFENQMNLNSIKIKKYLEIGHTVAIKNIVAQGYGVSCLSKYVLEDLVKLGKIKILNTPQLNLKQYYYILIHKDKTISKVMKKMFNVLKVDLENKKLVCNVLSH